MRVLCACLRYVIASCISAWVPVKEVISLIGELCDQAICFLTSSQKSSALPLYVQGCTTIKENSFNHKSGLLINFQLLHYVVITWEEILT